MPDLDELLMPGAISRVTVRGRIANTPADVNDDLFITIGAYDGHRQQWGPCPWIPAGVLPVRGDECLVVFDEEETPWVLLAERALPRPRATLLLPSEAEHG